VKYRYLALAALTSAALCACSDVGAYTISGKAWPGGTVRYYNAAPDQAWPVARAVYVWNHSGARVQLVPSSRKDAQLVIEHFPHRRCVGHAEATLGFTSGARMHLPRVDERSPVCNSYASAAMVAHELGHVLGLGHEERGCALMNPSGSWNGATLCPHAELWTWRCGLLEQDDIAGAVRIYGGRAATTRDASCNVYPAIATPTRFSAAYRADQSGVELRFVRPAAPLLPLFLGARATGDGAFALASEQNHCPATLTSARRYRWNVAPGAQMLFYDRGRAAGRHCFAVWALDALGRPSAAAAYAWVDVPAPTRRRQSG
jgi:hypothetical protein